MPRKPAPTAGTDAHGGIAGTGVTAGADGSDGAAGTAPAVTGATAVENPRLEAAKQAAAAMLQEAIQPLRDTAATKGTNQAPRPRRRPSAVPPHLRRSASPPSVKSAKSVVPYDILPAPQATSSARHQTSGRRGPNTVEGKAAVAGNAIKHGMTSAAFVIDGVESREEWEAERDAFIASYNPQSDAERAVLDRAARLRWRIRRVERTEAAAVATAMEEVAADWRNATQRWQDYPATPEAAQQRLDNARAVFDLLQSVPRLKAGHYLDPALGDAVVRCLEDGDDFGIESFRGAFATGAQLRLAADRIARASEVPVEQVYEVGARNAAAAVEEAQAMCDYVDSSIARLRRRAQVLPETMLYALSRHEAQLDRAYHRSMTEFQALKAAREGKDFPIHRLEIHA